MALTFFSCTKETALSKIEEDKGCIERQIVSVHEHSGFNINNTTVAIINDLFLNNGLDNANYHYYFYSHDSVQTYFPPYEKFDQKIIRVEEYTNGLKIFTGQILFNFKNNIFNFRNGASTNGTSLNTEPQLTVGQIRTLFLGHIEQFDHKGDQYKDSCFTAEFGYYNTNAGTSNLPENLIKAWKITLKNKIYPSEYPVAYYQDDDGKLLYYDNGIRYSR